MGASRDQFIKYPRTPHLFGSKGTKDDRHMDEKSSNAFIAEAHEVKLEPSATNA